MTKKISKIPSRIENAQVDELGNPMEVTGAKDILDDDKGKRQNVINQEVDEAIGDDETPGSIKGRIKGLENQVGEGGTVDERISEAVAPKANSADVYTKTETYNKTQLDNMITTPEIAYKDYDTYADMLAETEHPAGAIYRVANYDGEAEDVDTGKYSEYSWDGTEYHLMAVRDHGVDDEPTDGSNNLVRSGGVNDALNFNFKRDSFSGASPYLHIKQGQHVLFYNNYTENVLLYLRNTASGSNVVSIGAVAAKSYYEYTAEAETFYLRVQVSSPIDTCDVWCIKDQSLIGLLKYSRNITLNTTREASRVNIVLKTNDGTEIELSTLHMAPADSGRAGVMSSEDKTKLDTLYNIINDNIISELGVADNKLMTQNGITKALNEKSVESTKTATSATGNNEIYFPIKKGDVVNIELTTEFSTEFGYYIYYKSFENQVELIDAPNVLLLNGRVYSFVANRDAWGFRFRHNNVSSITTENPFTVTIKISKEIVEDGILGLVNTNKELIIPVRGDKQFDYFNNEGTFYTIYENNSLQYGGLHRFKAVKATDISSTVNIGSVYGRVNYKKETIVTRSFDTDYNKYVLFTNPNNISYKLKFVTIDYYRNNYERIPYNVAYLGCGRNVISPYNAKYCHGSYITLDTEFSYIIYASNGIRNTETTSDYQSNIYLTILEDGKKEILSKPIFSDHLYVESYNGHELIDPYNYSIVNRGDDILIRCGYRWNSTHIWMYKTFNKSSWVLSDVAPQTITYNGNTYPWTHKNYIDMVNTLYNKSYDDTYQPVTQQVIKTVKYNGTYYMVACSKVDGNVDDTNVPFVLMSSTDAIDWSPIAMLTDSYKSSEQAIAIKDNKLFMIFRTGHVGMYYGVYGLDGSTIKSPVRLNNAEASMPVAFVYNDNVYAIYNKTSTVIPSGTYYGRTCISICYLNDSNELVELKEYNSAAGFQYYDVAIRGNIIRFSNTEDNGGTNLGDGTGGPGPYVQCSVCDIKNEDLVIPSN